MHVCYDRPVCENYVAFIPGSNLCGVPSIRLTNIIRSIPKEHYQNNIKPSDKISKADDFRVCLLESGSLCF